MLATPENRAAIAALQDVLFGLISGAGERLPSPLYLHGPSGSGKTFLVQALVAEATASGVEVCVLSANDFAADADRTGAFEAELLVIEDLQHLPARHTDELCRILDERRDRATLITALHGPAQLAHRGARLPARLANRLAGGLVVALTPMQAPSRRRLLEVLAAEARVNVAGDILDWLAQQLTGGGRQLQGAIRQLKALQRLQTRALQLAEIRKHFEAQTPTMRRIAERVGDYYQIAIKQLLSAHRSHDVLLPRQVGMYLARQLTGLSLQKIGAHFGGRDHKTVLHACSKIELTLKRDAALAGAVRQLRAQLA